MKWCCEGFRSVFQNAGQRGVGVFYSTAPDDKFILQFRSIDPDDSLDPAEGPITLVDDVPIIFCPWCGKKLRKKYSRNLGELTRNDLKVTLE